MDIDAADFRPARLVRPEDAFALPGISLVEAALQDGWLHVLDKASGQSPTGGVISLPPHAVEWLTA